MKTDHTDREWVVVRIDGKIASVSTDYRMLAEISARLAGGCARNSANGTALYGNITATTTDFKEIWKLKTETQWEDLMLFGTEFQKKVWKKLWDLTHTDERTRLISYSDFADLCGNRAGVRAVAHAIGLNPVAVIIPCHLVIPKESIDRITDIRRKAESTIFKGDEICTDSLLRDKGFDFGEYSLGKPLKKELIRMELRLQQQAGQ